ncbi:MAG: RNA polymerase sigma factor [Candidatus Parcubacteria bacterium]|nr:RNA polymerase sigma factor [Candidatus Parcubacteria bacterium]
MQLQETLTEAYRRYMRELRRSAFYKVHDQAISEDLVQDTFTKTWMYLIRGGKINVMKSFLYHILNNLIVDEYRKHKTASLDAIAEKGYEPSDDSSGHLFNFLDGKAASLSIKSLPKKYQKVMCMRYVQGLSLREMSLLSGQSKNTMAVQAHRGLEKLRLLHNAV